MTKPQAVKLKWRDYLSAKKGEFEPEHITAFDEYFDQFAEPTDKCIGCGNEFGEGILGAFFGAMEGRTSIEWGMCNGEAYCIKCKWPYRGIHRNIGPVNHISNWFLAYHPDYVKSDKAEKEA